MVVYLVLAFTSCPCSDNYFPDYYETQVCGKAVESVEEAKNIAEDFVKEWNEERAWSDWSIDSMSVMGIELGKPPFEVATYCAEDDGEWRWYDPLTQYFYVANEGAEEVTE